MSDNRVKEVESFNKGNLKHVEVKEKDCKPTQADIEAEKKANKEAEQQQIQKT